ncbi:hypothetical protein [uncultured Methylobacterium sp.]|uniref:hypothetical protein n=1 Tax=uncultured Methylobacterium sp. TaxID=157278 RepID=UPI002593D5A7|nr:hypothetical protein [uncultured Methylobacterium sp.]
MASATPLRSDGFDLQESISKILHHVEAGKASERGVEPASFAQEVSSVPNPALDARQWSELIKRVRAAANQLRQTEADAEEQERRVQDLLGKVREDIAHAGERVKAAEARAREIEARAEVSIRAAEARAEAAEKRAAVAEEWLSRVQEAIAREFALPSDAA